MSSSLHPDLLRDLHAGLAHHREGRTEAAEVLYRKVLKRVPTQPDALNLLGVIAQERGRPARAVQLISQALRSKPRFPEALVNLARAQREAGDCEGAADSARNAILLQPNLAEAHIQLGRALLDLKDDEASAAASRAAIALVPRSLDAHVNLAAALTRLKLWEDAGQAYQAAHALKPDRLETLKDFARVLRELNLHEDAVRFLDRAVVLAPNDSDLLVAHASALKRAQDVPRAMEACRRAIALAPERSDLWIMLGSSFANLGRFGDARDAFNRALALDPDSAEARRGLVSSGQLEASEGELQRLGALAEDPAQSVGARAAAAFSLGGLFDKAGEYDLAFDRYAQANRLARDAHADTVGLFDPDALRRHVDSIIASFTPDTMRAASDWGDASALPVFIVGMPRSGTTLTEQIAASHPLVHGGGESQAIGQIVGRLSGRGGGMGPAHWNPDDVRREASAHLARLGQAGGDAALVTDKMPDNIFWLGAIATLFPRARIVLCRRDLRDVCLSCFFQHFTAGLNWTHDLSDLAFRAKEVERLVAHWREVLPTPILEIQYESMVNDLEGESRRLIDFLGLPWDSACLAFHETERPVLTASVWQVRQPLYTTAVGRWRLYREHLTPLLDGLAGIVTGDENR